MAKEKFNRSKPHVNIGTIGHVVPVRNISHDNSHDISRILVVEPSHGSAVAVLYVAHEALFRFQKFQQSVMGVPV